MTNLFTLEILTPEKSFFKSEVESIIVNTLTGQMGVLKNHVPMVVAISIGEVRIKTSNGSWVQAVLSEGFMEITDSNEVVILVDTAEWPHEIDVNRAMEAQRRAKEKMEKADSLKEYTRGKAAMLRAIERLKAVRKNRG